MRQWLTLLLYQWFATPLSGGKDDCILATALAEQMGLPCAKVVIEYVFRYSAALYAWIRSCL